MQNDHIDFLREVGEPHRKKYGQFLTHPDVAKFMVDWALYSGEKSLYDPAFGLGAFLNAVSGLEVQFDGSEIDSKILEYWIKAPNGNGNQARIFNEDYLLSWGKSHANIVCNPPYMRFQKFLNRNCVSKAFIENLNLRLSGYTNTASAFLLKSLSELSGSGRLAYIMPLEFLNTGYGSIVKNRLIENGHLVSVIRLDCEKEVFPDATTSVGIILFDAARSYSHVNFHIAGSIKELKQILDCQPINRIPVKSLEADSKWLSHFQQQCFSVHADLTVPLRYYGRFSRGIATGANKFFAMKPSQSRRWKINRRELLPCITRSPQIRSAVFKQENYKELEENDLPVLLFNGKGSYSKSAKAYIENGEERGFNTRFLTRNRKPWYKLEARRPSPLLLSVFFRGGYKIIRNKTNALNLTCFHGFQPNLVGQDYIDRLFIYLASTSGREITSLSSRRYGDALDKFEPNDLNNVRVPQPNIFNEISSKTMTKAMSYIERKNNVPDWVNRQFEKMKLIHHPTS